MTPLAPSAPVPKYQRLADHYRSAIQAGSLLPGQRMPSLRDMLRQHAVSLSTVMQVCRLLESEGLLEARPRSGYFVRSVQAARLASATRLRWSRPPSTACCKR